MAEKPENQSPFDLDAGVPQIVGELRPKPKFADSISKRVLGAAIGFLGLLGVIFLYSMDAMDKKKAPKPEVVDVKKVAEGTEADGVPKELMGDPSDGADEKTRSHRATLVKPEKPVAASAVADSGQGTMFPNASGTQVPSLSGAQIPKIKANGETEKNHVPTQQEIADEAARQEQEKLRQAREAKQEQARSTGLMARGFDAGESSGNSTAPIANNPMAINPAARAQFGNYLPTAAPTMPQGGTSGEQEEKLNFVKDSAKEDRSYHQYKPVSALSRNEVKVGSFIPLALSQGINSDLPGQITARVTEAVYDTLSGCRLLIPAMSTVIGKYDSKVALGQNRMLVVWNGIVFPNGDELNLAGMQGYDTAGYAGLNSEVDNHFWRLFGLAFGMSMVTATVQLSVPQTTGQGSVPSPSQTIATALAQQYGQLGGQILGRYMNVQPTLKNYPGERFLIVVPHTIVLNHVWRNRCETSEQ